MGIKNDLQVRKKNTLKKFKKYVGKHFEFLAQTF